MGNNNIKTTNDILVKVDHNNLIYLDPNSVLNNGMVEPRAVDPENLMMYVNLEADLIPRTTLIANDAKSTLISVAEGTLNFMKNADGADYDTRWTDAYTDFNQRTTTLTNFGEPGKVNVNFPTVTQANSGRDATAQSFGIDNISIKVMGANFIPRVDIRFIDVRGKTLFDSPANSPYSAFFHIPWPIFYLTVKGYYGKAIKYRLHLIKFNSRYNPNNGNFEIDCNFVGSTYAYLADISMEAVLNSPYFYLTQSTEPEKYNEKTERYEKIAFKTTKGYRVLKSVYQEYINKGFLPKTFPVRTLRDVIILAGRLNKIVERELFGEVVSHHTLAALDEYEKIITDTRKMINFWADKYLSGANQTLPEVGPRIDPISGVEEDVKWYVVNDKTKDKPIELLENIIKKAVEKMDSNIAFGDKKSNKKIEGEKIVTNTISCAGLRDITKFYTKVTTINGEIIVIDIDRLKDEIDVIFRTYREQRNTIELEIEKLMNEVVVHHKDFGLGFEPTVRNIIAVILANAETYIRLMKDVHEKAFEQAGERKRIFEENIVKTSGILRDGGNTIFPWPEVKLSSSKGKEMVLVYPGSREMQQKLKSYDKNLWPEVDFVENFYSIGLKLKDNLSSKEGTVDNIYYVFGDSVNDTKKDISILTNIMNFVPYTNKSASSILYEIYERAKYTTSLSPFDTDSIRELAEVEYSNLKNQISSDTDIVDLLKKNVTSYAGLLSQLESITTKYPYYLDQLPTTDYISEGLYTDFTVTKPTTISNAISNSSEYSKLTEFLKNYKPETYRKDIYPFNSSTYLGYLSTASSMANNSQLNGLLKVNPPNDFISSPVNPDMWIKDGFLTNLFTNTINIGGINKHILNTPYFHKQLYSDFIKTQTLEKYSGSAYLLLNSLPFKDLNDVITFGGNAANISTLVSSIFREIGASHYIPYHMMLKWGSIYHRYKKYINDGIDIIGNVTESIDGQLYFDNNNGVTFDTIPDINTGVVKTVNRSNSSDIGFHPYYETIFHQIANGYGFLNIDSQVSSYTESISNGLVKLYNGTAVGANTWTSLVDQSKFNAEDQRYVLLPTNGVNMVNGNNFELAEQENFRVIWGIGTQYDPNIDYTEYSFPAYNEYLKTTSNEFSLSTNYQKVVDLIATFKPEILEAFELAFLDFSSEKLNEAVAYKPYDTTYTKFQDLLNAIISVEKVNNDPTNNFDFFESVKNKQLTNLINITTTIKSNNNLIRLSISNPREINDYVLGGFTKTNVEHFSIDPYDPSQLIANLGNIELYLGEDMGGYYQNFFLTNDVALNEENIKQFRPLIYMYSGLREKGETPTKPEFVDYLKNTLINTPTNTATKVKSSPDRLREFLDHITHKINSDLEAKSEGEQVSEIFDGWNDDSTLKLELYNYFKSFNDKWTSGNSIGQRSLIEEFLFLDRANKDIGNEVYLDLTKVLKLGLKQNAKINLYSAISLLVQDTGFDIRALPAYVNFYGTNTSNSTKIIPSRDVARNMFGSFLDVDYQDASPKIILQFVGPTSKHPEMEDISKRKYLYENDGFDIGDVNNNPIIIAPNIFSTTDFTKSNKVVAFEVSFGDPHQSIFKTVELDQSTIRNTSESFYVIENLGRSEGGDSVAQVDIGLWNIYRQASYQCTVTCMGNVMIQPTMYFYLKNVPLFRGSYWITEVTHNIKSTGIETSFKGTRIPQLALPDPDDSFIRSYRPLFDRVLKDAVRKVNKEEQSLGLTGITITDGSGSHTVELGVPLIQGEELIPNAGVEPYGIPYNGMDGVTTVQKVRYNNQEWLRARVVEIDGKNYKIPSDRSMSIASRVENAPDIKWSDIPEDASVYETKFDIKRFKDQKADILINDYTVTEFYNPVGDRTVKLTTNINNESKSYRGPVSVGPADISGYGLALSKSIMRQLGVGDGEVVFFRLTQ